MPRLKFCKAKVTNINSYKYLPTDDGHERLNALHLKIINKEVIPKGQPQYYKILLVIRVCPSSVGLAVDHNLLKGRRVTLPCSNRSTCSFQEGSDIYLECEVKANPAHYKIVWYHQVGYSTKKLVPPDIYTLASGTTS